MADHRKKFDPTYIDHFELLKAAQEEYYTNPRVCEAEDCEDAVPFAERNKQRFCGHSCRAATINRTRATVASRRVKICPQCNCEFKKKGAKFCTVECHQSSLRNERVLKIEMWLAGNLSPSGQNGELSDWAKAYLLEEVQHKCSECNWSKVHPVTNKVPLQVDHVDGNYQNNTKSNLRVLCPNCHSLTATYGGLNRGKGRGYRVKGRGTA